MELFEKIWRKNCPLFFLLASRYDSNVEKILPITLSNIYLVEFESKKKCNIWLNMSSAYVSCWLCHFITRYAYSTCMLFYDFRIPKHKTATANQLVHGTTLLNALINFSIFWKKITYVKVWQCIKPVSLHPFCFNSFFFLFCLRCLPF
jgi:hypothetical protein